jgi:hypothetical protein
MEQLKVGTNGLL